MTKTCTKCREVKPADEFYKDLSKKDGLQSRCKLCTNNASTAWRESNPERALEIAAKYRNANREKVRHAVARWQVANPEKYKASVVKYRETNRGRCRAAAAKWRAANLDKARAADARRLAENPEAHRIYEHNRRARKRGNGGKLSTGLTERLYKLQRGKCACCGKPLGKKYHRDHIMPLALGGTNTDDNIQLLRSTCNQQKHAKHPVEFMQQRGFLL